jgi:hypothetical protein
VDYQALVDLSTSCKKMQVSPRIHLGPNVTHQEHSLYRTNTKQLTASPNHLNPLPSMDNTVEAVLWTYRDEYKAEGDTSIFNRIIELDRKGSFGYYTRLFGRDK